MKFFVYISLLLTVAFQASAQTSIPVEDDSFRACLLANYSQLMDGDQLDTVQAKAFNGTLDCPDNDIVTIPELVYFHNITEMDFSNNQLISLPSLDNLTQLRLLYVARNNLKEIPRVDSLQLLERFICWKNELTELPDLTMLDNLFRLDVPVNQLTTFPPLSPVAPMRTILVDDNFITDLPDLSIYPDLEIVKVVNNNMSFDEMNKIIDQPDPSIYDFYPQKFFDVLPDLVIDEGDSLMLINPLDSGNPNVIKRWMKDGNFLAYEGDTLLLYPAHVVNGGKYVSVVTSSQFPNKPIFTNQTNIIVNECPEVNLVTVDVEDAACNTPGQVVVQSTEAYSYELLGTQMYIPNANNYFEAVDAGVYKLIIKHPSGCEKSIEEIIVNSTSCEEIIITPDEDGYQDTFYFDYEGVGVLYDKFGNKVTKLTLPTHWDATVDQKKVTPGYYTLDVNQGEKQVGVTVVY